MEESPALPRGFFSDVGVPGRFYLCPFDEATGLYEVLLRRRDGVSCHRLPLAQIQTWSAAEGTAAAAFVEGLIKRLDAPAASFAGLDLASPVIMGIVNVTPDSFSDGGETLKATDAIRRGLTMASAGARIIDVGGESTRPGAEPIGNDEEQARVVPVIEALVAEGCTVSIDTRHADVMAASLDAGARIINDVTALRGDEDALALASVRQVPVILMHMQGEPGTMQDDPQYEFAPLDIYDFLAERIGACEAAGIPKSRIAIDPGIGFGKTVQHNLEIISRLRLFQGLGCPLVLGASRKRFIGSLGGGAPPGQRLGGSIAAAIAGASAGANVIRVHDVAETRQALDIWQAIAASRDR